MFLIYANQSNKSPGGTHIWKWRGCADTSPKVGSFGDRLNKEKKVSFSENKRKIGGHLVRTIKKKGSFSEDFSLKKKSGSFREALNLSAKFYLATTWIPPSKLILGTYYKVVIYWWKWASLSESMAPNSNYLLHVNQIRKFMYVPDLCQNRLGKIIFLAIFTKLHLCTGNFRILCRCFDLSF